MVHRRWVQLYDDGSTHLKEAMKRHLNKIRYGEVATQNAQSQMENYDPLAI
jgi:hypothetical protein